MHIVACNNACYLCPKTEVYDAYPATASAVLTVINVISFSYSSLQLPI